MSLPSWLTLFTATEVWVYDLANWDITKIACASGKKREKKEEELKQLPTLKAAGNNDGGGLLSGKLGLTVRTIVLHFMMFLWLN